MHLFTSLIIEKLILQQFNNDEKKKNLENIFEEVKTSVYNELNSKFE